MNCPVPTQLKQGSTVLKTGDNQTHLVSPTEANWTHLVSQTNPALAQITLFRCTCGRSGGIETGFPACCSILFTHLGYHGLRDILVRSDMKTYGSMLNMWKHVRTHKGAWKLENTFKRMKRLVKTYSNAWKGLWKHENMWIHRCVSCQLWQPAIRNCCHTAVHCSMGSVKKQYISCKPINALWQYEQRYLPYPIIELLAELDLSTNNKSFIASKEQKQKDN